MAPCCPLFAVTLFSVASAARVRNFLTKQSASYQLELDNYANIQYYGRFTVGGQTLPVMYDTGSFEVVILSNLCTDCPNLLRYNNENSSSFENSDVEYEHNFGSGSVYSKKGFETVRLGDSASPLAVEHFPFWQVINHEIKAWNKKEARFAGIVGLGHSDIVPEGFGEEGVKTTTLMAAVSLDSFAICLERGESFAPGRLLFGARSVLQKAPFQVLQVQGKSHWSVPLTEMHAEGIKEDGEHCRPSCGAIVDSGTSLIAAPPAAAAFVAELQGMVAQDCSNMHELPVLQFQLDGKQVELPPAAYVWRVAQGNAVLCKAAFMTIDKSSDLGPVWIFGMPFLRYYYTVFDREANQMHITRSQPNCEPEGAASAGSLTGNKANEVPGVTAFSAMDYQPLDADPAQAMVPTWAMGSGRIDL